jgi:hypothetical protein
MIDNTDDSPSMRSEVVEFADAVGQPEVGVDKPCRFRRDDLHVGIVCRQSIPAVHRVSKIGCCTKSPAIAKSVSTQ